MPELWPFAAACATGFLIALVGTGFLCRLLAGKGILDEPNQRSSHQQAKPRGGGLAILAAVAAGIGILAIAGTPLPSGIIMVGIAAFVLALISWADDVRGLSPLVRFIPQFICVGIVLYIAPVSELPLIGALPGWLQSGLLALAWLWFINLYNFMDGIDGITGVETIVITLGIALVCIFNRDLIGLQGPALVIAAAAAGFLVWNWAPAKIFMGDVGSVPLGFVLGWLLLDMAGNGYLAAALILPGYYLIDATITLLSRLRRGKKIWQAHREHAYQHAVQNGLSHADVSLRVGITGCALTGLAIVSTAYPWPAGVTACIVVVLFWRYLRHVTP
ncbi:glycosyltransferase family 4 protein [Thalassospiraceae bacterium LMO-JJ14]|nr:glycosyltransferase family 4 protein [Thalassospiraceae bacterium LMO-JJ14]